LSETPGLLTPLTPDLPRSARDRLSPEGEGGIGNRRPPRAGRFRPGQSGNPRGRPRNARGVGALVQRALNERVEAKENGRRRRITLLEAVVKQLVNRAANGDQRATQFVFSLLHADQGRPPPRAAHEIDEGDALVVAELVRRFSPQPP
jgi:Family of unknown function (DUF5681)